MSQPTFGSFEDHIVAAYGYLREALPKLACESKLCGSCGLRKYDNIEEKKLANRMQTTLSFLEELMGKSRSGWRPEAEINEHLRLTGNGLYTEMWSSKRTIPCLCPAKPCPKHDPTGRTL